MSSESDTALTYKFFNEIKKEQKSAILEKNMAIIREWRMADTNRQYSIEYRPNSVLFRFTHKPKADFFPSTGRWRSQNRTYRGGAAKFLNWYNKQ